MVVERLFPWPGFDGNSKIFCPESRRPQKLWPLMKQLHVAGAMDVILGNLSGRRGQRSPFIAEVQLAGPSNGTNGMRKETATARFGGKVFTGLLVFSFF